MGIFSYQSGNSQGILIDVLGMNPQIYYLTKYEKEPGVISRGIQGRGAPLLKLLLTLGAQPP